MHQEETRKEQMPNENAVPEKVLTPSWRAFFNYYIATVLCWFGPHLNPEFAGQLGLTPDRGLILGLILLAAVWYLKYGQEYRLSETGIAKVKRFPKGEEALEWDEVQRFEMRRGILFIWLNIGNISVIPRQAGRQPLVLSGVPDPKEVIRVMEKYRG
jgi:hypothetical protein